MSFSQQYLLPQSPRRTLPDEGEIWKILQSPTFYCYIFIFRNTTRVPKKNVEEKKIIKKQKKKISFLLNPSPSSAKMLDISTNIASFSWGKLFLFWLGKFRIIITILAFGINVYLCWRDPILKQGELPCLGRHLASRIMIN